MNETAEKKVEKEFIINNFISLRLEGNLTWIYVNNERYKKCYCLYINQFSPECRNENELNFINSIDDISGILAFWVDPRFKNYIDSEDPDPIIPIEDQFWVYCSNLQVWAENNYNTFLLDKYLAFPLLEELFRIGDPTARKVFKSEICKRFLNGKIKTIDYLLKQNFLYHFNKKELENLFDQFSFKVFDKMILRDIIPYLSSFANLRNQKCINFFKNKIFEIIDKINDTNIIIYISLLVKDYSEYFTELEIMKLNTLFNNFKINDPVEVSFDHMRLIDLPKGLFDLKTIKSLDLRNNFLKELPEAIENLSSLKKLYLGYCEKLPKSIGNFKALKVLSIRFNTHIKTLPDSITNLSSLEILSVCCGGIVVPLFIRGKLSTLPESIGNLKSLKVLKLIANKIQFLPESIGNLESLQILNLDNNQIKILPLSLGNLKKLKELSLMDNQLDQLPDSIGDLESLQELNLSYNHIKTLPLSLGNLKKLEYLYLRNNELEQTSDLESILTNLRKKKVKIYI